MNYKFIVTAVLVLNLFTQIHAIARADIVPYPISRLHVHVAGETNRLRNQY